MTEASSSETKPKKQPENNSGEISFRYSAPEVVAVLPNEGELDSAVEDLFVSGFDRRQIGVLAYSRNGRDLADPPAGRASLADLEDDPQTPIGAFVSLHSRAELNTAAVGVPMYAAAIGA